jgi:hypothetical protein
MNRRQFGRIATVAAALPFTPALAQRVDKYAEQLTNGEFNWFPLNRLKPTELNTDGSSPPSISIHPSPSATCGAAADRCCCARAMRESCRPPVTYWREADHGGVSLAAPIVNTRRTIFSGHFGPTSRCPPDSKGAPAAAAERARIVSFQPRLKRRSVAYEVSPERVNYAVFSAPLKAVFALTERYRTATGPQESPRARRSRGIGPVPDQAYA